MPVSLVDLLTADGVQLRGSGTNLSAKCPFHKDSSPSFSVNVTEDVYLCHGCGAKGNARTYLVEKRGFDPFEAADFIKRGGGAAPLPPARPPKIYPKLPSQHTWSHEYRDPDGNVLYAVCRYPKGHKPKITQHTPVDGGWIMRGPGKKQKHVLYRLPELLGAPQTQQVLIVEGEKCADTVSRHYARGVVTTWLGGSNAFGEGYQHIDRTDWTPLYNRPILLVSDNDEVGRNVMRAIADRLLPHCPKVRIVLNPGEGGDDDIHDWLERGGKDEAGKLIRELVEDVALPKDPPPEGPAPTVQCASHADLADLYHQQHLEDDAATIRYDVDTGVWWTWGATGWTVCHTILDDLAKLGRQCFVKVMAEGYTKPDRRAGGAIMTAGGAERLIRGRRGILTTSNAWDVDIDLVALPGRALLDIASGKTIDQTHQHLCRRRLSCAPSTDEQFQDSRWGQFLVECLPDAAVLEWVQRAVGQALLGRGQEHIILFCYGKSRTGKTTFLESIRAAVADYGVTAAAQTFMRKQTGSDHPAGIARLAGARYIVTGEIGDGDILDDGLVKDISGRSPVTARFMRQNEFSFVSSALLCMQGNTKPGARTLAGLQDRMRFIPFQVRQAVLDKTLKHALLAPTEQAAVIHWLAEGARRWIEDGLSDTPSAVVAEYTDFVTETPVGAFLHERTSDGDDEASIHNGDLYESYTSWCKDAGVDHPVTKIKLGKLLRESHEWKMGGNGNQFWIGRGLVSKLIN